MPPYPLAPRVMPERAGRGSSTANWLIIGRRARETGASRKLRLAVAAGLRVRIPIRAREMHVHAVAAACGRRAPD